MNNKYANKITSNDLDLPNTVGVIYSDVKREYFPTESQYITEKDAEDEAKIIASYLEKLNITPSLFPANEELPERLRKNLPEMVINLVGSIKGNEYLASTVPGVLELLEIPYTGAGILGESLSYNKFLVKKLLEQNGVPVPNYQLFSAATDQINPYLRYPIITKLNEIHGAVEITKDSISENEKHLRERLKFLIDTYKQPVVAEEFIVGREITAFVLEGFNKKVYFGEKIFKIESKYKFASFEDQWNEENEDSYHYNKYSDPLLREYVLKAFDITKMSDYGKFDIRMDQSGRYFFIDSNSNPAFGPIETHAAMSYVLELYGLNFQDILKRLLLNTIRDSKVIDIQIDALKV